MADFETPSTSTDAPALEGGDGGGGRSLQVRERLKTAPRSFSPLSAASFSAALPVPHHC